MATATQINPAKQYRCWMGFAGPAGIVQTNEVLRGSDPRVTSAAEYFVDHLDTAPHEQPNAYSMVAEMAAARQAEEDARKLAAHLAAAKANPVKLEAARIVTYQATRDIVAHYDGRPATIKKGSTVLEGDALLHEVPDAFKALR